MLLSYSIFPTTFVRDCSSAQKPLVEKISWIMDRKLGRRGGRLKTLCPVISSSASSNSLFSHHYNLFIENNQATGCKESQFYSLPFGQAVASMC